MTVNAQSVSFVKSHLAQVIESVRGGAGPVLITQQGAAAAVIQDAAEYQRTQDALAMLKLVAIARHEAAQGATYSHDQVFTAARQRLANRVAEQE